MRGIRVIKTFITQPVEIQTQVQPQDVFPIAVEMIKNTQLQSLSNEIH